MSELCCLLLAAKIKLVLMVSFLFKKKKVRQVCPDARKSFKW